MFDKDFDNFDKEVRHFQRFFVILWIPGLVLGVGCVGFLIWVIVTLMNFFGVI